LRLQLDVLNLFNAQTNQIEYLYVSRLPVEPLDGIADRHLHPVEPLVVRLALAGRFLDRQRKARRNPGGESRRAKDEASAENFARQNLQNEKRFQLPKIIFLHCYVGPRTDEIRLPDLRFVITVLSFGSCR
jgi:hypothetical protein